MIGTGRLRANTRNDAVIAYSYRMIGRRTRHEAKMARIEQQETAVSKIRSPASIKMIRLIEKLAPSEGYTQSALDSVRLMRDGITAAAAAGRVGYESTSQFSREFKRLFGRTPVEEARDMRESFTLSPAVRFVRTPFRLPTAHSCTRRPTAGTGLPRLTRV